MSNIEKLSTFFTRLSQGQLNLLNTCPRKFQYTYCDQLNFPLSPEQHQKVSWGNHFHTLIQQRELGLPIEALFKEEEQLHNSVQALIKAAPEIFAVNSQAWREAEHCRTLDFQGYLLTVIYDLLIAEEHQGQIFDWKTYLQPENKKLVETNWQTRLYLYLLVETSNYLPQQVSLTYCFVKLPEEPGFLTFNYNQEKHQQTEQDLITLLTQLDVWLNNYLTKEIPFPQIPEFKGECQYCHFAARCHRHQEINSSPTEGLSIAEIEEVSL